MSDQRELVLVHDELESDPTTTVLTGFTGDDALLDMFWYAYGRESDAWLLHIMGLLPDWWQPVHAVMASHMERVEDLVEDPHRDALTRWDDMTLGERRRLRYGWRVVPTIDGGGRIYRVSDRRESILADASIQAILDEMPVPALGPSEVYPRLAISAR